MFISSRLRVDVFRDELRRGLDGCKLFSKQAKKTCRARFQVLYDDVQGNANRPLQAKSVVENDNASQCNVNCKPQYLSFWREAQRELVNIFLRWASRAPCLTFVIIPLSDVYLSSIGRGACNSRRERFKRQLFIANWIIIITQAANNNSTKRNSQRAATN